MLRSISSAVRTNKILGRVALAGIPNIPFTMNIEGVGRFRIRLRRDRRFWVRHPLEHERIFLGMLARLARPGDTVYDVGANLGLYARFFAGVFGAARVVAFEPMSDNRQDLEANLRLGNIQQRVRVFECALADADGDELLQVDQVASGAAVLDRVSGGRASESHRQYGVPGRTQRVRVTTLDGLIERESLPAPNLIKIDVEGAEALVLAGAARTIERHHPRLAIELHGPDTARAVLPLLHAHEYRVFAYGERDGRHWWGPVGPDAARESTQQYEFHFVFAAEDAALLEPRPQPWHAGPSAR